MSKLNKRTKIGICVFLALIVCVGIFVSTNNKDTQSKPLKPTINNVEVGVDVDMDAFPQKAELSVEPVSDKTEKEKIKQIIKEKNKDNENIAAIGIYDISVSDKDGKELQPDKDVKISFQNKYFGNKNLKSKVFHMKETKDGLKAEKLKGKEKKGKFTAATDGFSYYVVEFTYNDLQYVLEGNTSEPLKNVLKEIGLSGEVTAVEGSNDSLFSFEKKNNEWYVTANKAFDTEEWMKVTIDGITYDIVVTDAADEAFAEFDSSTGVLRIFRAASGSYTNGQTSGTKTYYTGIEDITGNDAPKWYAKRADVTSVVIEDTFKPKTAYNMFYDMSNLTSITGISNLDTRNVTTMNGMFSGCNTLTSLDVSNFDTSNVTDMNSMFSFCYALTNLDLSNFDTSNVTTMSYMFYECTLTSLDVSSFNTSNVKKMNFMFCYCNALTSLDLSNFNTSSVTDMSYMFYDCAALARIYASDIWDTSSVTSSSYMFVGCTNLVGGKGTTFNSSYTDKTRAKIDGGTSDPGYLTAAEAYAEFDSSNGKLRIFKAAPSKYTDGQTSGTKTYWTGIEDITGNTNPKWYDKKVSVKNVVIEDTFSPKTAYRMFYGMTNLTSITGISNLDTSNVTTMNSMFRSFPALTSLDLSTFNTSNVTDMSYMFDTCLALTSLNVSNWNTSNVTDMRYMFNGCTDLKILDLSSFNTSNVTDMAHMLGHCSDLTRIYASNTWNTNRVTSSTYMFSSCNKLVGGQGTTYSSSYTDKTRAKIDGGTSDPGYFTQGPSEMYAELDSYTGVLRIFRATSGIYTDGQTSGTKTYWTGIEDITGETNPKWYAKKTSVKNVVIEDAFSPKTAYEMFDGMPNLTSITGISNLNTSNVTTMNSMFYYCKALTSLDVSNFDTSNVTDMSTMFYSCKALKNLDVSSFNTSNVTDMRNMFAGCDNLTTIYASDTWDTSSVTSSSFMFDRCTNLVGGQGTTYSSSYTDKTRAKIDGGTSNPGYLTAAEAYAEFDSSTGVLRIFRDDKGKYTNGQTSGTKTYYADIEKITGNSTPKWYEKRESVTSVVIEDAFSPKTANELFHGMSNLTDITGLDKLSLSNTTNMDSMFIGCSSLTSLDLSSLDTSTITDMGYVFYHCTSLTNLDLSNWDTSNVTSMSNMFNMYEESSSLTSLDLSSFDTSNVTNMQNMFYKCTGLKTIYVSTKWDTSAVETSIYMFRDCTSLVGGKGTTYNASYTDAARAKIDGGTSDPGYLTKATEAFAEFDSSTGVLRIFRDDKGKYTDGQTSGTKTYYTGIEDVTSDYEEWFSCYDSVTSVVIEDKFSPKTACCLFCEMYNLTSITGLNNLDTSNVTNMESMFAGCYSLTSLDLSSLDTSNVTTMENMFGGCDSLTSINLSSFDTSNVTTMEAMFYECRSITDLDLSNFNTSNVVNMKDMFYECDSIEELDLSNFDTSKVTNMNQTFVGCNSLTTLNLSGWDTSSVVNMTGMFMYSGNLVTIYVDGDKWDTSNVTSSADMFEECEALVGGKGTTYNSSYIDKTRAHVDGGTSNPGYLSEIVSEYTLTANPNGGTLVGSEFGTDAGTTNNHDFTVVPDTTDNNKIGTASRTGYTFDGWYTAATGGSKVFSNTGAAVQGDYWTNSGSLAKWQGTDDLTVYAHWTANTYVVTFHCMGGQKGSEGDPFTRNMTMGAASNNEMYPPTREGYTFAGWYTSASGGEKIYAYVSDTQILAVPGCSMWDNNRKWIYASDVDLYAQWTPKTYTISYAGLDSAAGLPTSGTFDSSVSIPNPEKNGYSFAGWNISGMDSCTHTIGNTTTTDTSVNGTKATTFMNLRSSSGTVTFTATWTTFKATLKYHANGGTTESGTYKVGTDSIMENASGTDYTTEVFTTDTYKDLYNVVSTFGLSKTGYHIDGTDAWNTLANGNGVNLNENNTSASQTNAVTTTRINGGTQITEDKSVTVYANWKANTYTVQYNANGGSGTAPASQSFTYGQSKNLQSNTFTTPSSAWTFNGWNTKSDGTGTNYTETQSVSNLTAENGATVTLYAMWTKQVTFYSGIDRATTKTANQVYGANGVVVPEGTATINSWTFAGWREDVNANANSLYAKTGKINPTSTTLYAVYTRDLTLEYTAGGGTGTAPSDTTATQVYNTSNVISTPSFTLAANTFTRTGYDFAGWDVGQPGTAYTSWVPTVNDAVVTKETEALWNGKPYTVTFDPNGGSFKNSTSTTNLGVVFGSNQNYNPGIAEKADAGFLGWYTSNGTMVFDASGICVAGAYWTASGSSGKWNRTGNLTVHAEWLSTNGTRVMFAVGKSSDSAPAAGSTVQGGTQYGMPANVKGEGSQYALFDGINSVKTGYRYHTRSLAFDGDIRSYHYIDNNGNVMRVQ